MIRKTAAALALAALAALGLACSGGAPETPAAPAAPAARTASGAAFLPGMQSRAPEDGGTFRRGLPSEPVTLNPVVAADFTSYMVYKWIFDPLVDMDKDMKPVGVLAESWTVSPDGRTYTFKLRRGVTWHDGKPFTAADVLFTVRAIRDATVDAITKRSTFEQVESVKKLDDYTVAFTWKQPYAPALADMVLYIVPEHVYAFPPGKGEQFNRNPRNADPVGSGPYTLVEWKRGESLSLAANPHYFAGRPHVEGLLLKVIPQLQTETSAFQTGALDLTRLSPDTFARLSADPAFARQAHVFEYPARQFFYLAWNQDGSNPFFRDKRVRRGLSMALNRPGLVEKVLKGHGVLCTGPGFPGGWELDPSVEPLPYDPKAAAALLEEAGWKDSDGDGIRDQGGAPFEFECLYPQEAGDFQRFLEFFQQDLRKVGVRMSLRPLEWSVFVGRTQRHQFQSFLSGYNMGDDPDPYKVYHSSQAALLPSGEGVGANDCSYANPELDRLLEEQLRTVDPEARKALLWKIHGILAEEQPVTYLFLPTSLAAVSSRFQHVEASRAGYGLFTWYPSLLEWWVPKEKQ